MVRYRYTMPDLGEVSSLLAFLHYEQCATAKGLNEAEVRSLWLVAHRRTVIRSKRRRFANMVEETCDNTLSLDSPRPSPLSLKNA
jgi:hypothetical protein